jgi:hypothetical protein
MQVLAAIFREDFTVEDIPARLNSNDGWTWTQRLFRYEDSFREIIHRGICRPNGSSALVYWKPSELLSTTYEGTVTVETACQGEIRLVDLLDGAVYEIPENLIERNNNGTVILKGIPLTDYPLLVTFGDFMQ